MKKIVKILDYNDKYEGCNRQEVYIDDKEVFYVYNLSECPEDAVIGRDLFIASDFIKAIKLGMKLYEEGIRELEIVTEEGDE